MYLSQSMTTLALLLMLVGVIFYQTIDIHKESVLSDIDASSIDLKATSVEHVVATTIPKAFNKALHDSELKAMQDGFFNSPEEAKLYIEGKTVNITNSYLANVSAEYKKIGYDFKYTNTTVFVSDMPDGYTFTVNYSYWYMLKKGNDIVKQRNVVGAQNITVKSIIDAYEWYRFRNPVYEDRNYWIETVNEDIYGVNESYWIEDLTYINEEYKVWVKVSIPAHKNISFNITREGSNTPNGDAVFEFFDDLDAVDMNKWEYSSAGPYAYNGGIIEMWGNWGGPWVPSNPTFTQYIITNEVYSTPFVFEFKGRVDERNPGDADIGMIYADGTNWVDNSRNSGYRPPAITIDKSRTKYNDKIPDTDWHKYKITIKSDSMSLYQDWSSSIYTKTGNLPSQGGVGITGDTEVTSRKAYMDYVFVRKYADESNIQIDITNTSNNKWRITITNNNNYDIADYQVALNATNNLNDISNKIYINNINDHLNISAFRREVKLFRIWVKIDNLESHGITKLLVRKNNTYSQCNPQDIFEFFDDLETWDGWTQYSSGSVIQTSDYVRSGSYALKKIDNNDPNGGYKDIGETLGRDIIVECWNYRPNYASGTYDRVGVIDDSGNGYGLMHSCQDSYLGVDKRTNYHANYVGTNKLNHDKETWYFMQFIIKDDGTLTSNLYDENLNLLGSQSHSDSSYSEFTRAYVFGGHDYAIDDLRIRKYATYGTTTNKLDDTTWEIKLQNPNDYNLTEFQVYFNASNDNTSDDIYLQDSNAQLNISQEVSKNNLLYINTKNFEMDDNYPSILDRLANLTYRTFGKGIKYSE